MRKENWKAFCEHIIATDGNPGSKVAKQCHLEGAFCELCMRNIGRKQLVQNAKQILSMMEERNR